VWHIGMLLGNDHKTNNETITIYRQRPVRSSGSNVGSGVFYVGMPEAMSRD
jgi:hypothetical protein